MCIELSGRKMNRLSFIMLCVFCVLFNTQETLCIRYSHPNEWKITSGKNRFICRVVTCYVSITAFENERQQHQTIAARMVSREGATIIRTTHNYMLHMIFSYHLRNSKKQ